MATRMCVLRLNIPISEAVLKRVLVIGAAHCVVTAANHLGARTLVFATKLSATNVDVAN